jgi:hypothetical protein
MKIHLGFFSLTLIKKKAPNNWRLSRGLYKFDYLQPAAFKAAL